MVRALTDFNFLGVILYFRSEERIASAAVADSLSSVRALLRRGERDCGEGDDEGHLEPEGNPAPGGVISMTSEELKALVAVDFGCFRTGSTGFCGGDERDLNLEDRLQSLRLEAS